MKTTIKEYVIDEVNEFLTEHFENKENHPVIAVSDIPNMALAQNMFGCQSYEGKCALNYLRDQGCYTFKFGDEDENWHKKLQVHGNCTLIYLNENMWVKS